MSSLISRRTVKYAFPFFVNNLFMCLIIFSCSSSVVLFILILITHSFTLTICLNTFFNPNALLTYVSNSYSPFLTSQGEPQTKSNSLMDYMPEPIYSKKDLKKLEKQKKKEEKEKKIQEEKEKQQQLIEDMKKAKKEKKEKTKKEKKAKEEIPVTRPVSHSTSINSPSSAPTLFQTLTQKEDKTAKAQSSHFVPFSETKESQVQETSRLRIIPNAADIESKPSSFTPIQSTPQGEASKSGSKELIICKNCGAILSSDYAFCNKCGTSI